MESLSDQQLLADYSKRHSEAAFEELVRRHIDLVHAAALRMVRDSKLAEDVTQGAFVALANNAPKLMDRPVLSGWLHRTAQNLAANTVRSDVRRRAREQKAVAMSELNAATPEASWDQIAPHLDTALGELSEPDREVVLLRYFEKKSAQDMPAVLGISAEAAQKRVSRAVERLRDFFAKRGVTVGTGGLALISANAVQAAPVGLAVTITTAATLTGTLAAPVAATTAKAIAMTTLQKTLITATVVVLTGATIYEARQISQLRDQVKNYEQQQATLAGQLQQLQSERDEARKQLSTIQDEKDPLPDNSAELLRLRGMAGVARRAVKEAEQLRAQLAQQAIEATNNPVTAVMAGAMKQALQGQVESRLSRMITSLNLTPEQVQTARDILMRQTEAMAAGMQQAVSGKFDMKELTALAGDAGNPDDLIKALLTPEQQAAFPTYQEKEAEHNAGLVANQELLAMYSTLGLNEQQMDQVFAVLYEFNLDQLTGNSKQPFANPAEAMQWQLDQKVKALEPLLTESQMESYRQQQALQARMVKDIMSKMEGSADAK